MESDKPGRSLFLWIAFGAASATIIMMASSMIHYDPTSGAGTLIDELGGAVPYALFAAVMTYYLLKPRKIEKPELRALSRSVLQADVVVLITTLCVFFGIMLFIILLMPFPIPGGTGVQNPGGSIFDVTLLDLPILNPAFVLTIVVMVILVGSILIFTFIRTKVETPQEIAEEEAGVKSIKAARGRTIDDEYRRAIIAKYVEGRDIMVTQGAALRESTTPREFEGSVLVVAKAASKDFVPLTRLFEEARFSIHSVGEPEKTKAESHYERLLRSRREKRVDHS